MNRGGLRAGAGRPAEEQKLSVIVRLRTTVASRLRSTIPEKTRSQWIEKLIVQGLEEHSNSG